MPTVKGKLLAGDRVGERFEERGIACGLGAFEAFYPEFQLRDASAKV